MSGLAKGATVRILKAGSKPGFNGGDPDYMKKDEEVEVLRVFKNGSIKARSTVGGGVGNRIVLLQSGDFSEPLRPLGQVPEGGIPADDPRLDWLWEDAERVADMSGFCTEYEKLLRMLNLPGRLRTHTVKMASADGIEIVARVKARSQRQAEQRLREQMNAHAISDASIEGQSVETALAGALEGS